MSERQPPRVAPATVAPAAAVRPVRSAQRPRAPQASSGVGERVSRAWSRHPLVSMARHRKRLTFFVGLRDMLRAGLPLTTAFTELSRGSDTDGFRRAIVQVAAAVAQGSGLAEAMRRQPGWFEPAAVAALEAGEASGTLDTALSGIISRLETMQRLRWRTFVLCLYPVYLLGAFIVGGSILEAAGGVMNSGSADNLVSAALGGILSRTLSTLGCGLALFVAPLVLAAVKLEEAWERVRLHVPLLGGFHEKLQASRFCEVLGASLGAGLDAARSLQMAIEATGNSRLKARTGQAVQRLRDGATFTDVVQWLGVLDGEALRQVSVGERAGRIEPLLLQQSQSLSESSLRRLQVLIVGIVILMVVGLMGLSLVRLISFQGDYFQRIESLSHG